MKTTHFLFYILVFFVACATPRNPTGGPKDNTPPKLLSSTPDSAQTNFSERKLVLTFDEYFTTSNIQTQTIFSPPLKFKPTFKTKGQSLIITLKDTLKPNTTYTINFGESIKDLNEGNVLKNFNIVFSTGSYIDSFHMAGQVLSAKTNEPEENVKVLLFREYSDSNIFLNQPYYISTTSKTGHFSFRHISNDSFYIFAIKDINNNYKLEKGELIAFNKTAVSPDSGMVTLMLANHNHADTLALLNSKIDKTGKLILVFNQILTVSENSVKIHHNIPTQGKNTRNYIHISRDSLTVFLPIQTRELDSLNIQVQLDKDTFTIIEKSPDFKVSPIQINKFTKKIAPHKALTLSFNNPIRTYSSNKIKLIQDSVTVEHEGLEQIGLQHLELKASLKPGKNYTLILADSFSSDFNSSYTSHDTISFSTLYQESTGSVQLKVSCETCTDEQPLIVELYKGDKLVQTETVLATSTLQYLYLNPGSYSLVAYQDLNNNGIWDQHDFLIKKQAEPRYFYTKKIDVRANWEVKDLIFIID